jgi:DNA-binding NarL/FixJ family response regulator
MRARAEHTDVILLEATTACETRVIEELALVAPEAKVVAYGILDEDRQALRCAEAGAAAFVTGEATAEQLVSAILGVARGEVNCSPRLAALLIKRLRSLAQHMAPVGTDARLTPRERGIAALIDEGLSKRRLQRVSGSKSAQSRTTSTISWKSLRSPAGPKPQPVSGIHA